MKTQNQIFKPLALSLATLTFFTALGLAQAQLTREEHLAQARQSWHDEFSTDLPYDNYPGFSMAQLTRKCSGFKNLYPTHPQQDLKKYSLSQWTSYDIEKLSGKDRECLVPSKTVRPDGSVLCFRSDELHLEILSDTFMDDCGNMYRAFQRLQYLKQDETMGTMFSKGRTAYADPASDWVGQYIAGPTFPVEATQFIKIGPLLSTDKAKIDRLRLKALAGNLRFDAKTKTFVEKPKP
jgi:hypothetical protein